MSYIRQSIKTSSFHVKYVPFLALGGLIVWTDSTRLLSLLSVVISFTLYPIVYGRIVETVKSDKTSSWADLISKHFVNYFLLTIIVIIPVMALSYMYSDLDYVKKTTVKAFAGAFTQIATVYMWPLVFINARVLRSIPQGFSSLLHKGRQIVPIILLILLTAIIKVMAHLSLIYIFQSKNVLLIYGIGYLQNLINVYIGLLVFSLATSILLAENNGPHSSPLSTP